MRRCISINGLEELVLLAVRKLELDGNAYGITIQKAVSDATGIDHSIGSLYATIYRLEHKGLVYSYVGDPRSVRGGRAVTFYHVTLFGIGEIERARLAREALQ